MGARRVDVQETHTLFRSSTVFFKADDNPLPRRAQSTGPGVTLYPDDDDSEVETPPRGRGMRTNTTESTETRINRRLSVDAAGYHSSHPHPQQQDHHPLPPLADLPPYTPPMSPTMAPARSLSRHFTENPALTLEESRNALRADLEDGRSPSTSRLNSPIVAASPSYGSSASSFRSLSRQPSIVDIPEFDIEGGDGNIPRDTSNSRISPSPSRPALARQHSSDSEERRGRRNTRFSLTTISNAFVDSIKDSVRSRSPGSRERPSQSRDRDVSARRGRGRTPQRRSSPPETVEPAPTALKKDRSLLGRVSNALKAEPEEHKEAGHGWKEFKKGK